MGLFNQTPAQYLSSAALSGSFAALDAVINEVIGTGVVSGLTLTNPITNEVLCSTGVAIAGHVVQLTSAQSLNLAAGTWDLYLCQPVFTTSSGVPVAGSYPPNTSGVDAGVLTSVVHGTTPSAPGALLATVVSTGTAITSINNAPAGRNTIPGPAPTGTRNVYPAQANFTSQPNGTATAFTLTETPNPTGSLVVFKNGIVIDPTGYTLSGTTVTFPTAPLNTDKISASFTY